MNQLLIRNRNAEKSNQLKGCIWTIRKHDGLEKKEIGSKSEWLEVLADVFSESLIAHTSSERDELWKKVRTIHEEWKKSKATEQAN